MNTPATAIPDLSQLRGVVAPEILAAAEVASRKLREAGIPHALAGGLAVGAHGYPRTTDDVDFLVPRSQRDLAIATLENAGFTAPTGV